MSKFQQALSAGNLDWLKKIPKSDLHNHGFLGGKRSRAKKTYGIEISPPPEFFSIHDLDNWLESHYACHFTGKDGFKKALQLSFIQAKEDGIVKLEMDLDLFFLSRFNNNAIELTQTINKIYTKISPEICFIPIIGIPRESSIESINHFLPALLDIDFFRGIDLYGDEKFRPIKKYKGIFRAAQKKGYLLKAHVGEFGTADDVQEAVETLELNHVQHGISAADSKKTMQWLSDHGILLNICPSSNIYLKRVRSILNHPIRILFDQGVNVTVNTDDMAVFNQSVSEEYINLYTNKLFEAKELDIIRNNGLGNSIDYNVSPIRGHSLDRRNEARGDLHQIQ